jgi:hypothetical protein
VQSGKYRSCSLSVSPPERLTLREREPRSDGRRRKALREGGQRKAQTLAAQEVHGCELQCLERTCRPSPSRSFSVLMPTPCMPRNAVTSDYTVNGDCADRRIPPQVAGMVQ